MILVFDTLEECDKFTKLYETYGKTIYFTLKRYTNDETLIEDLSQDIFIRLAYHLDKIDLNNYKKSQNYIITATRNYCINYLRDKSKIQEESFEAHLNLSSPSDEIVDNMIRSEDLSYLEKAIGELNEIYRSVLELRYVNEFSNEEIAAFLNLQKRTVETRLYRANLLLKDKLRGYLHGK